MLRSAAASVDAMSDAVAAAADGDLARGVHRKIEKLLRQADKFLARTAAAEDKARRQNRFVRKAEKRLKKVRRVIEKARARGLIAGPLGDEVTASADRAIDAMAVLRANLTP